LPVVATDALGDHEQDIVSAKDSYLFASLHLVDTDESLDRSEAMADLIEFLVHLVEFQERPRYESGPAGAQVAPLQQSAHSGSRVHRHIRILGPKGLLPVHKNDPQVIRTGATPLL
jgi:hypothetical protein